MTIYATDEDIRTFTKIKKQGRKRKCACGCNMPSTHYGLAGGVVMVSGCELSVRRWVKS